MEATVEKCLDQCRRLLDALIDMQHEGIKRLADTRVHAALSSDGFFEISSLIINIDEMAKRLSGKNNFMNLQAIRIEFDLLREMFERGRLE